MQWIKSHLNVVVAGSVSLLALVALVLGFILPDPVSAMRRDESLLTPLQSPGGASQGALTARRNEHLQIRTILLTEQNKTVAQENDHKLLKPAEFLFPKENPNNQTAPFDFVQEYRRKQQELLARLKAGDQPSAVEISEVADRMKRAREQLDFEKEGGANKPGPRPTGQPANPLGTPFSATPLGGTPTLGPDATPEERVRLDPMSRAAVNKAHSIWCYASLQSLDPRQSITESSASRPQLDDMWYAQVALWVQEDILTSLANLNKQVADSLPAEDRWVGNLPFKHLRAFLVGGYVPPSAGTAGPGGPAGGAFTSSFNSTGEIGGPPPMDTSSVMSKQGSTAAVDKIRMSLDMVIDAQALPRVIDAICRSGFYTVLQVSYEAVQPNLTLTGYVYGDRPVIHVWMVVEGSLLRNKYEKIMPESVKADIASGKLVGGSTTSVGGGATPFNSFGPRMGPMGPRGPMGPMGPMGPEGDPRGQRMRNFP